MVRLNDLRVSFTENEGLPFSRVLTESNIRKVLNQHEVEFRDRQFNPLVTIWAFLSQVLSEDHSCRDAVSRILAHRAASSEPLCSPNTAGYCKARSRLSCDVLSTLARRSAVDLEAGAREQWKWLGRKVYIIDGSHVSMPDTVENQAEYPQPSSQKPGVGFPLARIAVLLSLATGACHDLAIAPYAGKGTGEVNLLRRMYGSLNAGDVLLGDALFDNYFIVSELLQRGIQVVFRVQHQRTSASLKKRYSQDDAVFVWTRPPRRRSMSRHRFKQYPEQLEIRQLSVDARDRDNRPTEFQVFTTLLSQEISSKELGNLFERRWEGEVDIRSIKQTLQMDILRCKTPGMVRKEIWVHLLAYNLLRTVMAVAADEEDIHPRKISFKGAKQTVTAFAPKIEAAVPHTRPALITEMLKAIAYHRVGNRPDRWEPRAVKRRPNRHDRLTYARELAKLPKNRPRWYGKP